MRKQICFLLSSILNYTNLNIVVSFRFSRLDTSTTNNRSFTQREQTMCSSHRRSISFVLLAFVLICICHSSPVVSRPLSDRAPRVSLSLSLSVDRVTTNIVTKMQAMLMVTRALNT